MAESDGTKLLVQGLIDKLDGMRVGFSMLMNPRDEIRQELLLLSISTNNSGLDSAARFGVELGKDIEAEIEIIFAMQDRLRDYLRVL